jgi:hypothetical protein
VREVHDQTPPAIRSKAQCSTFNTVNFVMVLMEEGIAISWALSLMSKNVKCLHQVKASLLKIPSGLQLDLSTIWLIDCVNDVLKKKKKKKETMKTTRPPPPSLTQVNSIAS